MVFQSLRFVQAARVRSDQVESTIEAEIGFFLEVAAWGHGYATETAQTVMDAGFRQLGLHRVYATCAPENGASAWVLEKLGMRREGHLRQHFRMPNGWRDSYLYAVLDDEWDGDSATARGGADHGQADFVP